MTWGQKEGGIYLGPWNHDRWMSQKKDTQICCFPLLGNKSGAGPVNSQSWTFETNYTQKLHFYAISRHKQPPDNQTIKFWHQVSKKFYDMITTVFLGPSWGGGSEFFINGGSFFFQRERVLWSWLAGPSRTLY